MGASCACAGAMTAKLGAGAAAAAAGAPPSNAGITGIGPLPLLWLSRASTVCWKGEDPLGDVDILELWERRKEATAQDQPRLEE